MASEIVHLGNFFDDVHHQSNRDATALSFSHRSQLHLIVTLLARSKVHRIKVGWSPSSSSAQPSCLRYLPIHTTARHNADRSNIIHPDGSHGNIERTLQRNTDINSTRAGGRDTIAESCKIKGGSATSKASTRFEMGQSGTSRPDMGRSGT
jgi:hypothetical protein